MEDFRDEDVSGNGGLLQCDFDEECGVFELWVDYGSVQISHDKADKLYEWLGEALGKGK